MIVLASISDLLQVVTTSVAPLSVHASWVDITAFTQLPDETQTPITTIGTNTIVDGPAAATSRIVKSIHIRNTDPAVSNTVTLRHTDGSTVSEIEKVTLAAGESLSYTEGDGVRVLDASGSER